MPKNTMQEQLLILSLQEQKIPYKKIEINHRNGFGIVNNIKLEIKYPKSFLSNCDNLDKNKIYQYGFQGGFTTNNASVTIKRKDLLKPYIGRDDSFIKNTKVGLKRKDKTEFDFDYYQLIASCKFSLCPNWAGAWWNHEYAWTYRFIETCFSKSIPILFKDAPVGEKFRKDIFFFWEDDIHDISTAEYEQIVEENYKKSIRYWTINEKEKKEIIKS